MSERAPSAERLRELARRATTGRWKADLNSQPTIWAGSMRVADICGAVAVQEANARFVASACPATIEALVDRIEALAERIGKRSLIYMDNGHVLEAEMIGMIQEEIRALLHEPLEPGADHE